VNRVVVTGDQILVAHGAQPLGTLLAGAGQLRQAVEQVRAIAGGIPHAAVEIDERREDHERVAPQQDALGIGKQLEDLVDDEEVRRRLVEEVTDLAVIRRLRIEAHDEPAELGAVVLDPVRQLPAEVLDRVDGQMMRVVGRHAPPPQRVEKRDQQPRLRDGRDLGVGPEHALHERRPAPGDREDEYRCWQLVSV
jgi:hypothetical protein